MTDRVQLARTAIDGIRRSPGYGQLSAEQRSSLDGNLDRVRRVLDGGQAPPVEDPYANLGTQRSAPPTAGYGSRVPSASVARSGAMHSRGPRRPAPFARASATPNDLARGIGGGGNTGSGGDAQASPPAPPPPPPAATDLLGTRTADAVEAVNFSGFVRGLVSGTFQAIVDSTAEQVQDYAELVANIARSVDSFTRDNVTDNQTRDFLAKQHPKDLVLDMPRTGEERAPRVVPRSQAKGTSPEWLSKYGLEGEALTEELTEGHLLWSARPKLGEERMQTLATMVLMGINRIVVDEGHIRAKMQFHASAADVRSADVAQMAAASSGGIGGRQVGTGGAGSTMISTLRANAQADASMRADLMGEVNIKFRTQTFPLERFADSPAIQLINRHARWQEEAPPKPQNAPTPSTTGPPAAGPTRGDS